jgi:hypothetical protein
MDKARWEGVAEHSREKRGGRRNTTVHVSGVGRARWETDWLRHRHELAVGWSAWVEVGWSPRITGTEFRPGSAAPRLSHKSQE